MDHIFFTFVFGVECVPRFPPTPQKEYNRIKSFLGSWDALGLPGRAWVHVKKKPGKFRLEPKYKGVDSQILYLGKRPVQNIEL